MEFKGKVINICPLKSGVSQKTGKEWKAQEFVIQNEDNQTLVFNVFGEERLKQYDIKVGETYTVTVSFDGREYNGRWYNTVNATNVVKCGAEFNTNISMANNLSDDLPF